MAVLNAENHVVLMSMIDGSETVLAGLGKVALSPWSIRQFPYIYSPDGKFLAATGDNGSLRIWNIAEAHLETTIEAEVNGICPVRFLPKSRRLVTARRQQSADVEHIIQEWDMDTWD